MQQALDICARTADAPFVYAFDSGLATGSSQSPNQTINLATLSQGATLLVPGKPRKTQANAENDLTEEEEPVQYAATLWPVALYMAVMGGCHGEYSRDSGVCVHRDPEAPENLVITFMADWDHWMYGSGRVWPVLRSRHAFEDAGLEVPWLLKTREKLVLPNALGLFATGKDLLGKPVSSQPDAQLRAWGYEFHDSGSSAPLRGPHEPFDPRYACGATGGHLYVTPAGLYCIGDFGAQAIRSPLG